MVKKNSIKLFGSDKIRAVWDDEQEKWYFSVVDVVAVLTESKDFQTARKYWNKLKQRLKEEGFEPVTNCHQLKMPAADGKMRLTDVADTEQLLRIIQSVPSPKAEPFKMWLAKVGTARLDQMQDPELSIQQAMIDYKRLGYSDNWINQRLKSIEIRKDLTDQWKLHNVEEGVQYATLTDIIYQSWAGRTSKEYKQLKGLKKENLRDNMTNEELVLNMLAELSATSITKAKNPQTLDENKTCAKEGGDVARVAREQLESKTGRSVVSPLSAKRFFEAQQPKGELDDQSVCGEEQDK
uniref:BRO-N domain-containing protein n=1 Tax=Prevotella sp. TaxID=59823 RepID=UPI00402A1708